MAATCSTHSTLVVGGGQTGHLVLKLLLLAFCFEFRDVKTFLFFIQEHYSEKAMLCQIQFLQTDEYLYFRNIQHL